MGAAWVRLLPQSDPGYGFVDGATPELSMGVVRMWRGRGVGSRLLDALIAAARVRGLTSLSLSVEPDNYARRLYERVGFQHVGEVSGSLTMLLRLDVPADHRHAERATTGSRTGTLRVTIDLRDGRHSRSDRAVGRDHRIRHPAGGSPQTIAVKRA